MGLSLAVYSSTFFLGCAGNLLILLSVASHGQVISFVIFRSLIIVKADSLILKLESVFLGVLATDFYLYLSFVLHVNLKVRQNPTSVFLASLATADLLLLTVCLPLKMAKLFTFSWQVMQLEKIKRI